jgi:hypothetical protein
MYELVLETFLIMPLSMFEGLYRMPLKTIIGNYKMLLYIDIGRHFEKNASKDLLSPVYTRHSRMPKKAFEGILMTFKGIFKCLL